MNKKKDTIIELNDAQVKKINDDLKKINGKIFNKKITLAEQEGNGIFSFLLPTQCDHFQQFYNRRNVKVHVPIIRWSHCSKHVTIFIIIGKRN